MIVRPKVARALLSFAIGTRSLCIHLLSFAVSLHRNMSSGTDADCIL